MEKKEVYCQSCGMPMTAPELFGTNSDQSKNEEYCVYCFKDGAFTSDWTMEQMVDYCLEHGDISEYGYSDPLEARKAMLEYYKCLKRWKQD